MSFKNYLNDIENQKSVVMSFSRMNPITKGHEELLKSLVKLSKKDKSDAVLFLSHSQNAKKNPLSFADKVHSVKIAAPKGLTISNDTSLKNVFQATEKLINDGYKKITLVIGADRIGDFDSLYKYVNQWSNETAYLDIVSFSGKNRIGNYSGTRMRELAKEDNFEDFKKDLPDKFNNEQALEMFKKVQQGMGINT